VVECDRCHRKFTSYAALKQHYGDQHANAKWPDDFENKVTDERNLQAYKASQHPVQKSHTRLIIAVILIVIVLGAAWIYLPAMFQGGPVTSECASFPFAPIGNQDLAEHYHALLLIYVNGQQINLPVNLGEGDSGPCTQPLHVHASDPANGIIHIESPQLKSYTLGDFFKVWAATPNIGGPSPIVFNQNQIFSYSVGNGYELRVYMNGQQSTDYNNLVLQSHMTIVIVYGNSATDWSHYRDLSAQPWPYPNL
jgi:hypothetical protein